MSKTFYAKPREGGRVRMPDRGFKPMKPAGEHVPAIDYYNRLVITGDLILCDPPEPSAPAVEDDPTPNPETEATSDAATLTEEK